MKNVAWQDVVKLGEMNPIIDRYLVETRWHDGAMTQAQALLAMVDALDTRCAQLEQDAARYRWLREQANKDHGLVIRTDTISIHCLQDQGLDIAFDRELAKNPDFSGGKVASEDAGTSTT